MRIDQLLQSSRVEDRRGLSRGVRAGGLGVGTIIILGLVGWALGINPLYLIGGAEILSRLGGGSQQQTQTAPESAGVQRPSDQIQQFVSAVLGSTEVQWQEIFAREAHYLQGS